MWGTAWKHTKAQIQVPKKQMGKDCEKIMTYFPDEEQKETYFALTF